MSPSAHSCFSTTSFLCRAKYFLVEKLGNCRQLFPRGLDSHQTFTQGILSRVLSAIPAQMFSRHSNAGRIAVECVKVFEVGAHDITDFLLWKIGAQFPRCEEKIDFVENPWPALRRAADHDAVATGSGQNRARGIVLRLALKHVGARAAVDCERLNAGILRDASDSDSVFVPAVPSGARLEGHGRADRLDDTL